MTKKIRVVHIAQASGGVACYIDMLLRHLDKDKYENILICSQEYDADAFRPLVKHLEVVEMNRSDVRIKIYYNQNHGVNNNFANALSHSNGDYIFLCDQDDIWMPDKVRIVKKALENHMVVVHNAYIIDGEGKSLGKTYYECTPDKTGFWGNFWKSRYLGCCMAFRSSLLKELMPFPKNVFGHDYWIGLYCDFRYKVHFMDDVLISYRRHGNNVSTSAEKSTSSLYSMLIEKRLATLCKILIRRFTL